MFNEIRQKTIVCRKQHRCAWCGEHIKIAETAIYRAYTFDGFQWDWMHSECYQAMGETPHDDVDEGFLPGNYKRGSAEPR